MEIFWNTIAAYNAGTWPWQIALTFLGVVLTLLLYWRPSQGVRVAMKLYMVLLNFWIAGVYYLVYSGPRDHYNMLALFWAIMGGLWVYDLVVGRASLVRTGHHTTFAVVLFLMPLIYPLVSLALGRSFPMMMSPVMPCSVAVFTIALMLTFSERANVVLAMFLCHWTLIGLWKVYYFAVPEDYLLALSVVPALFLFFREYVASISSHASKPSPRVMNALLLTIGSLIGVFFLATLVHQFDLFADIW